MNRRNIFPASLLTVILSVISTLYRSQAQSTEPPISINGFTDVYYSYNLADPASRINKLRNFDIQENQFTLSLAEVVLQKSVSASSRVGFRLDLDYGTTNDVVQPAGISTLSIVQQAYVSALLPLGNGLAVDLGKFVTFMGNEVIESKDNWNYSRSFLFTFAIPYYHTGLRVSYPLSGSLTASLHVVNGWNTNIDNNKSKSFGAMLNFAPSASTGLVFNGMWGHENLTVIETGARNVYDIIFSQALTDNTTLALNADYGEAGTDQGLKPWRGAALYLRYAFGPATAIAVRGEVFDDPTGYATGVPGTLKEATLTLEQRLFDRLLLREELRDDFSTTPSFDGRNSSGTETNQATILAGITVSF